MSRSSESQTASIRPKRGARKRARRKKKICLVVTRLDEEGVPAGAIHELTEQEMVAEMAKKEVI